MNITLTVISNSKNKVVIMSEGDLFPPEKTRLIYLFPCEGLGLELAKTA